MARVTTADIARMREQLFFEGDARGRKMSRFWLLLILSAVIAAAGVVANSTATVIGAMIVAPLMIPILGAVVAVVLAERDNLLRSMALVVSGAASVVGVAWLLGLAISAPVVAATNPQVASRVTPRLIDLIAALATGAVGSVALARDDISDTLPGVAIAISLVPPLAVVGLTLESGATDQALGALLLFVTNVSAILASGLVVLTLYGAYARVHGPVNVASLSLRRGRAVVAIVAGLLVISVPLTLTSIRVARTTSTESTVTNVVDDWAHEAGWDVASVTTRPGGLLVRVTGPSPDPDVDLLQQQLEAAGIDGQTITVELVPSTVHDIVPNP